MRSGLLSTRDWKCGFRSRPRAPYSIDAAESHFGTGLADMGLFVVIPVSTDALAAPAETLLPRGEKGTVRLEIL